MAASLDTTISLVIRARQGDRGAIEQLASRYQSPLTRFAHGRMPAYARGLEETRGIVQRALMNTLDRLHTIDVTAAGSLLAYLRRVVLNLVRDQIRLARRRPMSSALSPDLVARDRDPLEQAIGHEIMDRYEAALLRLPADQQEAVIMKIEMDCNYREIAEALGRTSPEAARMLVRRALKALATLLKEPTIP